MDCFARRVKVHLLERSISFLVAKEGGQDRWDTVFDIHLALVPGTIQHGFDSSTAGTDTPIPSLYCTHPFMCTEWKSNYVVLAKRVASHLASWIASGPYKQIAAGTLVSDSFLRACSEKEKQPFFCCSFIEDPLLSIQTIIHTFGQVP